MQYSTTSMYNNIISIGVCMHFYIYTLCFYNFPDSHGYYFLCAHVVTTTISCSHWDTREMYGTPANNNYGLTTVTVGPCLAIKTLAAGQ